MIGLEGGSLKMALFEPEDLKQSAKWTFEPDGEYYRITSDSKNLKITNNDVQVVTASSSSTSKIKMVAVDDGYKFSDRTGKNWMKMDSSTLTSVDSESDASIFSIEPSQYYIKTYETDKGTFNEDNIIESMAKYQVSCDSGVVSGFKFTRDGNKFKYDYDCAEGGAASGTLNEKTLNTSGALNTDLTGIKGDAFVVDCADTGALANFRIVTGLDDTASYEYTCRDIDLDDDDDNGNISGNEVRYAFDATNTRGKVLASHNKLVCNEGSVLTGFKYSSEEGSSSDYRLSGICKKLST